MTNQDKDITAHYDHEVEYQVGKFDEPYCHDCNLLLNAPEVIDYEFSDELYEARADYER